MQQISNISQAQGLEYWTRRAHVAEEKCAALASELYTIEELLANANFTDKEKVYAITYFQWYTSTPATRDNGARYYNAQAIATRMGGPRVIPERPSAKEQAISPVHTKIKKAGLISTTIEAQKSNKTRQNQFDLLSPQFTLAARHVALEQSDKASNRGGRRVALHRECGGLCIERTTYSCMKCGRANIDEKLIQMIDESKWEQWKSEDVPCIHCHQLILPDVNYCPICGLTQTDETVTPATPATNEPPVPDWRAQRPCLACGGTLWAFVGWTEYEQEQEQQALWDCVTCSKKGINA